MFECIISFGRGLMKQVYKITVLSLLLCWGEVGVAMDKDMVKVKQNICESYLRVLNDAPVLKRRIAEIGKNSENPDIMIRELQEGVNLELVERYITSLGTDSLWKDLNYRDASRSGWQPSFHAERLMVMAKAYRDASGKYFGNPELGKAIHRAMGYWFAGNFRCRNWWYNQIGVPKMLGTAFLLMEPEMSADEKAKAIKYMENAKLGMTGQNSVWLAENVLVRALLLEDEQLFIEARNAILKELKVNERGEGIRPDWSFHQHGAMLQFGNYGLAFANTMAYWARMFQGTRFALTGEQLVTLRNYLLEGMQWIVWRRNMDISSSARQLFRWGLEGKALSYGKSIRNMEVADPSYGEVYRELYATHVLDDGKLNRCVGFRYYPFSDFAVLRTPEWYTTLKMSSNRVIGSEVVNSENLSGLYLGDGALYVYGRGDEYRDIFPVWDWTKIPGVTCYDDAGIIEADKAYHHRNHSDFVGGVSDGQTGISALKLNKKDVTGNKSYFFTGKSVVCIGSGIKGKNPGTVTTAVAQSLKRGNVLQAGKNGDQAYYHDGVAYVFSQGGTVKMTDCIQTGNWQKVAMLYEPAEVRKEVFRLWLDHGNQVNNSDYYYEVIPGVTEKDWQKAVKNSDVKVLAQNENVHAITDGKRQYAVFFSPGRVDLNKKVELSAGQGCIVMAEPGKDFYKLRVAAPDWKQETVRLKLTGAWTGEGCRYHAGTGETEVTVPVAGKQGAATELILSVK